MSTKPTTVPPRPRPSARPVTIKDAARKRRERDLDARIEALRPAMARFDAFLHANGISHREMLSSRAMAIWCGRPSSVTNLPRRWIQ
jgi:hypothetical protein